MLWQMRSVLFSCQRHYCVTPGRWLAFSVPHSPGPCDLLGVGGNLGMTSRGVMGQGPSQAGRVPRRPSGVPRVTTPVLSPLQLQRGGHRYDPGWGHHQV